MAKYKLTDPSTGMTLVVSGDSPPTEQEAAELFASAPSTQSLKQPAAEPSFMNRITDLARGRQEDMVGAIKEYKQGNQGLGSTLLQVVGKGGFGTAGDLIAEAVNSGVSAVVPDAIEEPIKQFAFEQLGKAYNSEVGQAVAEEWNKLSAEQQKNLEAGGNVMAFLLPKAKVKVAGEKIENVGKAITKERLRGTLKLPETPANKYAEAKRAFRDPIGFQAMVDTAADTPGVSPNKSFEANIKAIESGIADIDKQLFRELRQGDFDVTPNMIDDAVDKQLVTLVKENGFLQSDQAISNAFDFNIREMQKLLNKYPKTPQGVIRARREFDKLLSKKALDKAPESELIARDAVSKSLRRAMNDIAQAAAPTVGVKEALRKQSNLFSAWDNLAENYKVIPDTSEKALNFIKAHPYIAYGLATGSGFGATISLPAIAGGALLGVAGTGAYRQAQNVLKGAGKATQSIGRYTDLNRLPLLRSAVLYGSEEEEQQVPLQSAQNQQGQ